jgi:hypothetical protein
VTRLVGACPGELDAGALGRRGETHLLILRPLLGGRIAEDPSRSGAFFSSLVRVEGHGLALSMSRILRGTDRIADRDQAPNLGVYPFWMLASGGKA